MSKKLKITIRLVLLFFILFFDLIFDYKINDIQFYCW